MLRLEDEYGLISAEPAFWLARTFSRGHFVDKAQHLDRRISAALLDIFSLSSAHAYVIDRKHAPIGLSAVPGAAKALTWYLGPTRVAARGKMRSSGSMLGWLPSSAQSHDKHQLLTHPACLLRPYTAYNDGFSMVRASET